MKPPVLNSVPFLSVFSPLLSMRFQLVISKTLFPQVRISTNSSSSERNFEKKKKRTLTTESETEHTEHLTAMMDHVRYGTPEICVSLVILVVTVTVKFLRTQSLFTDFHTATVAYYIAPSSLPPTSQTKRRSHNIWRYFEPILMLIAVFMVCVLCGCGYSPPNENMWQIWRNHDGKKRGPEIFVYIQPIYTYT